MVYNHSLGTLEGPVVFRPSKIVILEGLHTLYSDTLRESIDFSLYVDPADDVKQEWKLKRDMEKRGYTQGEVMEEIENEAGRLCTIHCTPEGICGCSGPYRLFPLWKGSRMAEKYLPDHPLPDPHTRHFSWG